MKKCFMMEPKQKATWAEIDVGALVTPDFVKACIRCVVWTRNFFTEVFPCYSILLQGGDVLYEARRLSVGKGGHRAVEPTGQHQWHLCTLSGELENATASALDLTSNLHRQ